MPRNEQQRWERRLAVLERLGMPRSQRHFWTLEDLAEEVGLTVRATEGALYTLIRAQLAAYGDRTYISPPRQFWITAHGRFVLAMIRAAGSRQQVTIPTIQDRPRLDVAAALEDHRQAAGERCDCWYCSERRLAETC